MYKAILFIFCVSVLFQESIFSQLSDPSLRRIGYLDSNAISVSFYNDGAFSGFNIGTDIRGRWQGNDYIGDMSFMIGLEFPIHDYTGDGTPDTLHTVIIPRGPRFGQVSETSPVDGHFWGFNPIYGFLDSSQQSVAMSNNPASWPTLWADHPEWGSGVWNGFKGPNTFSTTLETYFKVDDAWDDEFNGYFLPDSSDSTIKGYGITVGIRYFQSNNPLYKNVIIRMFDITNNSDYTYEKVFLGNITGSMLGGDGDSGDDMVFYDSDNDFVYSWDYDCIGNIGQHIGYIAEGFIQAPGNNRIGNYDGFNISASPDMSDDEHLWKRFLPGNIDTLLPIYPQDGDYMYGTNYFSLAPGETKRVVTVLALGNTFSDVTQEVLYARALWNSQFDTSVVLNSIKLLNLDYHCTLSGEQTIQWNSLRNEGTIDLWYSVDNGETWEQIALSQPNTGSFLLNTNELEDTPFGVFKIFIKDSLGNIYGFNQSHVFTVNNSVNGKPYVRILSPIFSSDTVINDLSIDSQLLIGDAEPNPLNVLLYYSIDDGKNYKLFETYSTTPDTLPQAHSINLSLLANSTTSKLKIVVMDDSLSSFDTTSTFSKITVRDTLPASMVKLISGYCTIPYRINIIDSSQLVWNYYLVTFDDTAATGQKYLTVRNTSSGVDKISHEPIMPYTESSLFDGLSFYCEDRATQIDSNNSGWNPGTVRPLRFTFGKFFWSTTYPAYNGYRLPNDYQIIFYDHIVDTSLADTLYPASAIIPSQPINFIVKNVQKNENIKCVYWKTGTLSTVFSIYFVENVGTQKKRTWRLNLYETVGGALLPTSDTLSLNTIKGLSHLDSIFIGDVCDVPDNNLLPAEFKLDHNYPNPFNPVTTIKYQIPMLSKVKLCVYNILGQLVITLIDGVEQAGYRSVNWNAANVSSGVYYYRFEAQTLVNPHIGYERTGKMIVIK